MAEHLEITDSYGDTLKIYGSDRRVYLVTRMKKAGVAEQIYADLSLSLEQAREVRDHLDEILGEAGETAWGRAQKEPDVVEEIRKASHENDERILLPLFDAAKDLVRQALPEGADGYVVLDLGSDR